MGTVFHRMLEVDPVVPSLLRRAFARWLRERGWPDEDGEDLVLALDEAVTNVIDHAYRGQQDAARYRTVEVHAEQAPSRDGSRPRPAPRKSPPPQPPRRQ